MLLLALASAGLQAFAAHASQVLITTPGGGPAADPLPPRPVLRPASRPAALPPLPPPRWMSPPVVQGRLRAADIGLVINTEDPYSVQVGQAYIAARRLQPHQVLRVALPVKPELDEAEFGLLQQAIAAHFGPRTQALALAWVAPYRVGCNAITGAIALGLDLDLCRNSCAPSRLSPYFGSPVHQPWTSLGLRPAMLLAAPDEAQARAMIERGRTADRSLSRRGRGAANIWLLHTGDVARSVRAAVYPPAGPVPADFGSARPAGAAAQVHLKPAAELPQARRLLLALTGSVRAPLDPPPRWLPGGLGDHLTSFGGHLLGEHGQSTALEWIASGATASHGSVSEPCNHLQKFPHPQLLLLYYLQGSTAIEAYWKSVAWPQQSLFIGEPLAAPFARD